MASASATVSSVGTASAGSPTVLTAPRPTTVHVGASARTRAQLRRLAVFNRHLTYLALLVAVAVVPEFAPHRLLLFTVLGTTWIGVAAAARRFGPAGAAPRWQPWAEAGAIVLVVVLVPELLGYGVVVAAGQLAVGVTAYGLVAAVLPSLALAAVLPLALVARGTPVDAGFPALFAAFVPGILLVSASSRRDEDRARAEYEELLAGVEAVVWEGAPADRRAMTFVSPRVRELLGVEPQELADHWDRFIHDEDRDRERAALAAGLAGQDKFIVDYRLIGQDGRVNHLQDTIRVERDERGTPVRLRGLMVDVTRQKEVEATIRHQAQYDALTGLPNRQMFNDQLRRALEESERTGDGLAVLLLDLNGFKEVNDTLGHAVGDQLLQSISGRLAAYLPNRALVARLGGDEFAILLAPATPSSAATLADTVAACLQPPINIDDMTIQAAASVGIAMYPDDGDTPASLLRRADAAMYEAKQAGRNHVFATPEEDGTSVRRLQLLGELRASIATGDFELFHQPKIDLSTGRVVGTEGLIRWKHRQFGLLTPHEFIELSELSGLIQPLTRWVIEQGIRQCRRWRDEGLDLTVALNLSVRNFFDQGMPAYIAGLLSDYDVPGDQLVLEITEREVMADRALARSALSAFRALGVRIAVDDFGTGYSSLSQLQQLPIDEVKVDASFVAGMVQNPQDAVIVRSIVDLGHNLGLQVVAEGVEDVEQLRALRALGCDRAQGYLISTPLPPDEFLRWLHQRAMRVESGVTNGAEGPPLAAAPHVGQGRLGIPASHGLV